MELINQYLDIYAILATVITAVLAVVVPLLSVKCAKLATIVNKIKAVIAEMGTSYEDKKITKEELEAIIGKIKEVFSK